MSGIDSRPTLVGGRVLIPALWLLATFLLAPVASGQSVQVTIDRNEATVNDQLSLQVTVQGSQNAEPRLPDLSAFQVYTAGQQSQLNMVNGRTTVSITYNYVLRPRQIGTFKIGAATVEIDGKVYRSRAFNVRILKASAQPRESEGLFIRTNVSNKNPSVGEQVIYTWRFFRRVRAEDAKLLTPFEFEGFLVEDMGDIREYRSTRSGQEFLVSEIRKAIFPQEQGTLTIPGSELSCQVIVRSRGRRGGVFDSFFSRGTAQAKILTSPPIEVNVRPRPAAPSGFSGLVGDFGIRSSISKRELQVGESTTWKLTVSGTGNVQMIGEPPLPDLSQFKIYDDKPSSSIDRNGSELKGSRTYTKAIVPLAAGELSVPAIDLTYFDPEAGTYRTASTAPTLLTVRPAEGKEELRLTESVAPNTGKVAVRILADDILPIYKDLDAVSVAPFGHRADSKWFAGLLGPPLLYVGLLFARRRQRHLEVNMHLVRRRSALKRALQGLGEVDQAAKSGQHLEAAQIASRLLREYIGDKVALEGSAFTADEAEAQLRQCQVEEDVVNETRQRLQSLEMAQYAGASAEESSSLATELTTLLKQLESQIRVGRRR